MKDVPGFEGKYAATRNGRIWSYPKSTNHKKGGIFLKPREIPKGYLRVNLCVKNQAKDYYIHRLVASAYIPNPKKLPQVNHKNGIKTDNSVKNLEWTSCSDNHKHAFRIGLKSNVGQKRVIHRSR